MIIRIHTRQARIDGPSALHHIIIRGIECKRIFEDDKDREDFLERLSGLAEETMAPCYAWRSCRILYYVGFNIVGTKGDPCIQRHSLPDLKEMIASNGLHTLISIIFGFPGVIGARDTLTECTPVLN